MSEETPRRYASLGVVIAGIVAVVALVLVFGGGQTSKILSTVGSAIGPMTTGGVEPGDEAARGGDGSEETTGAAASGPEVAGAAAGPPTLLIVRTGTLELEVAALESTITAA